MNGMLDRIRPPEYQLKKLRSLDKIEIQNNVIISRLDRIIILLDDIRDKKCQCSGA